jgi:hypothetical protein
MKSPVTRRRKQLGERNVHIAALTDLRQASRLCYGCRRPARFPRVLISVLA